MSDLVERLKRNSLRIDQGINELCGSAAARITELETALAEAEGRVIADVVAWLRGEHREIRAMRSPVRNLDDIATALATGEWKK